MREQTEGRSSSDVDASTFQRLVEELGITLTHKIEREGISRIPNPNYVVTDIGAILRQSVHTYDLLYFLYSEEIRSHYGYRLAYNFAALPLVRTMIDCLYNITSLLADPIKRGPAFRKSGYHQLLKNLDQLTLDYGGQTKWDRYIEDQREILELDMRSVGLSATEARKQSLWPTLSKYLLLPKGKAAPTPYQVFLKSLTFGYWAEYSSISHATFQGLKSVAPFFLRDRVSQEQRLALTHRGDLLMTQHLARAAAILLCTETELQAFFRFDGARIPERLRQSWSALVVFVEVKELYDKRYDKLMSDAGI